MAARRQILLMDPETIAEAFGGVYANPTTQGVPERLTLLLSLFVNGNEFMRDAFASHCESGAMFAQRLGLPESVQHTIRYIWEQWDGKGVTYALEGAQTPVSSRILRFAQAMEVAYRHGGEPAATAIVRERSGRDLDPDIAFAYFKASRKTDFWEPPGPEPVQQTVLAMTPKLPGEEATDVDLENVCEVIADYIDIKSPATWGHSRAVAEVAVSIGSQLALGQEAITELRRAALVHDLGKVTVPCSALEKDQDHSTDEWEHLRLHPYYTERILSRVGPFQKLAALAGAHHELMDGSGYHKQLRGDQTSLSQRILALADAYVTLGKQKAENTDPEVILRDLAGSVETQFDPACYEGLVAYVRGQPSTPSPREAAGARRAGSLSERETQVLQEVARGLRNRDIAQNLVISEKTVERHLENIYNKLNVTSRTSAVVRAVQSGLVA